MKKFLKDDNESYLTKEQYLEIGGPNQLRIIKGWPQTYPEQRQKWPYVEKQNGAICLKGINTKSKEDQILAFKAASEFYEKAYRIMIRNDRHEEDDIELIEIPVCLNLALCYLKTNVFQPAIRYCTMAIEQIGRSQEFSISNAAKHEKAYFRRAQCFFAESDFDKARADAKQCIVISLKLGTSSIEATNLLKAIDKKEK